MSDSEANGNVVERRRHSIGGGSAEDLSEYTDADESISAPTEILAEFLSAIMLKDYETALKYCKLILHYEPNNSTAREFYPLIVEKIQIIKTEGELDEDFSDYSESAQSIDSSVSSSSSDECESRSSDSDATSASYSSLEDEEVDRDGCLRDSNDIANGNAISVRETEVTNDKTSKSDKYRNDEVKKNQYNLTGSRNACSETTKNSRLSSKKINNVRPSSYIRRNQDGTQDEKKTDTNMFEKNMFRQDQINAVDEMNNTIVSSDSESPTQPTVQESRGKGLKSFDGN